jgi:hypothetical protein
MVSVRLSSTTRRRDTSTEIEPEHGLDCIRQPLPPGFLDELSRVLGVHRRVDLALGLALAQTLNQAGTENGFNPGPKLCEGGIAGAKLADGADAHAAHGPLIGASMSTRHDFVFAAQHPKHEGFTHQYF